MAAVELQATPAAVSAILSRPLPSFVQGREPREKPVQGLQYTKQWNTVDFLGKYHLHNFVNQSYPTPGTAILQETKHRRAKDADVDRFEQGLAARAAKRRIRLQVRTDNALFQTKISIGTAIGRPLDDAEEVLRQKEAEVEQQQHPRFPDTKKEIGRFMKNVLSGNHNYVLYAATLGYKSFNYQDPETGNSALHFAVKAGHVEMVDELLKYTADPNLRNRLGDTAIHNIWFFWGTKRFNRTKEEREEQESKAHRMILSILSYGGFVDSVNQRGETALHIACRMGTTKIVLTLLGFRANHTLATKEGKTAALVAEENGRHEVSKMFAIWEAIRHRFVHMDFLVLWKAFLRDFQAVITSEKSAEAVLLDVNMDLQVTRVNREVQALEKGGLTIDDALLRQTYTQMKNADAAAPLPWHDTWAAFVEECHAKGIFSHALDPSAAGSVAASAAASAGDKRHREFDPERRKRDAASAHVESDAGLTRAQLANKKLPDRIAPEPRPRTREGTMTMKSQSRRRRASTRNASSFAGSSSGSIHGSPSRSPSLSPSHSPSRSPSATPGPRPSTSAMPRISLESIPSAGPFSPIETRSGLSGSGASFMSAGGAPSGVWDHAHASSEESLEGAAAPGAEPPRPLSAVQQRRIHSARLVALDAKFFRFTRRPATSSALFLSQRTPTAPLDGTEEQKSIMRHITSQGKEYDLVEKNRTVDLRVKLGFAVKEPPKSSLGDYTDGVVVTLHGERDQLYNKLNLKPLSNVEAIQAQMLAAAEERRKSKAGAKEAVIQAKVEMVQDRRLRFVEPEVIPPVRKLTLVERMAKERSAAAEEERKKRLGISGEAGDAAKNELMQSLLAPVDEDEGAESMPPPEGLLEEGAHRRKMKARQLKAIRGIHLLRRPEVVYGTGRLISTHNLTGHIEEPWSLTSGRYNVKAGDRSG